MHLLSAVPVVAAILATGATAIVIDKQARVDEHVSTAFVAATSTSEAIPSVQNHSVDHDNGVRKHTHTAWLTDITTISELVEDITITLTKHETAIISKSDAAPYTTVIPGEHHASPTLPPPHSVPTGLWPPHCMNNTCQGTSALSSHAANTISRSTETSTVTELSKETQSGTAGLPGLGCGCSIAADGSIECPFSGSTAPGGCATVAKVTSTHGIGSSRRPRQFAPSSAALNMVPRNTALPPLCNGEQCGPGISSAGADEDSTTMFPHVSMLDPGDYVGSASMTTLAKRAAPTENPSSVLASWTSAANLWPTGVTPFMAPTQIPPASCLPDVKFSFVLLTAAHAKDASNLTSRNSFVQAKLAAATNVDVLTVWLVNGTLIDSAHRIGAIVANGQFQFDGPPQAGTIYDAGWSVCDPDGKGYRLALGSNMTFWQCGSGDFSNTYAWRLTEACIEVDLFIGTPQSASYSGYATTLGMTTDAPSSITVLLKGRDASPIPAIRYDNEWAHHVVVAGSTYTVWDPYPIVTVSDAVYSAKAVTAFSPIQVAQPTGSVKKRDIDGIDNDVAIDLSYEWNTYTYTVPAYTGIDPADDDSSETTFTLPQRIITVTEAPYTVTTYASIAARDATATSDLVTSSSTDSWLTFMSAVPATTIAESNPGGWETTITEPAYTFTSLYKTTPYTTTFTYTNAADEVTETWTLTVGPPTFTTSTSPAGNGFASHISSLQARQEHPITTLTEVVSVPVETVYFTPAPTSSSSNSSSRVITSTIAASSMDTSSAPSAVASTSTVSSVPFAEPSITSQLSGTTRVAAGSEGGQFVVLATFALGFVAAVAAFCL